MARQPERRISHTGGMGLATQRNVRSWLQADARRIAHYVGLAPNTGHSTMRCPLFDDEVCSTSKTGHWRRDSVLSVLTQSGNRHPGCDRVLSGRSGYGSQYAEIAESSLNLTYDWRQPYNLSGQDSSSSSAVASFRSVSNPSAHIVKVIEPQELDQDFDCRGLFE